MKRKPQTTARPQRFRKRLFAARFGRLAAILALVVVLLPCLGRLALRLVPLPSSLFAPQVAELEFQDRHGRSLRIMRPEAGAFQHPVPYPEIPSSLVEATLAAEDHRFWQHHGVDWRSTCRAAWQLATHRRVLSGGSTVTQQLIKLAEPRPRTVWVKLLEALQAMRLEQVWDKQRILAEYLNRLDYGNFNHGCAAAASFYFAKPLGDLSPAECALLASLPQAPTRLNPIIHPDRARKRQQWVLHQMRARRWLTDQELRLALAEPFRLEKPRRVFEAPHFVDLLLSTREAELPSEAGPGRAIRTTLDLDLNRYAERTLREHLALLREQHVSNGAIVILDNRRGDVLSLVGSEDWFAPVAGQVNAAWAPRSAGSTFKPFTYLLALEHDATPATVVADVPAEFATATGLFAPVNYNRHCYGPVRYRLALANSLNLSAVKVLDSIGGPEPLLRLLQNCGLTTLDRPAEYYGLGLTIGNADARLLELANAYACLARLGQYQPYRLLAAEADRTPFAGARRLAEPGAAFLIADMLSDNDARTTAFGAESSLRFDFPVACKTGTSSDFRDNWAFGYTPEFTVGVWVGNDDGSPMEQVSGVTGAAPILHDLFEHLHQDSGTTWYPTPTNVVECLVHPVTGRRLVHPEPAADPGALEEKFLASNLPPVETPDDYAPGPGQSGPDGFASRRVVRLGSEYTDWLASGDNWLGDRAVAVENRTSPHILFPPPGTRLYLDADLHQQGRRLVLRAAGPSDLQWRSSSLAMIREGDRQIALLTEGRHEIVVSDPVSGTQDQTWIEVLTH